MTDQVVITDCDFGDGATEVDLLASRGIETRKESAIEEEEVIHVARGASGLIVQYARITQRVIEALPQLRAVVRYGVGVDTIDLEAARLRGVAVSGVVDYCTTEVADHAMALMLACIRSIAPADAAVKRGEWPTPSQLPLLTTLSGRHVSLVGFGRIAQAVATRLKGFDCRITAHDPYVDPEDMQSQGVHPVTLDEALQADIISLHSPAQPGGEPLLTESVVRQMRPDAIVINVSRGSLIDEQALALALAEGRIAAAGLDVLVNENSPDRRLSAISRATITPHIAYYSKSSLELLRHRAAETMADLLEGSRS